MVSNRKAGHDGDNQKVKRRNGFWSPFNAWWRALHEQTGQRASVAQMKEWYAQYAHQVWSPEEMPTVEEMLTLSKGMRTKEQVQDYFRSYRQCLKARKDGSKKPNARRPAARRQMSSPDRDMAEGFLAAMHDAAHSGQTSTSTASPLPQYQHSLEALGTQDGMLPLPALADQTIHDVYNVVQPVKVEEPESPSEAGSPRHTMDETEALDAVPAGGNQVWSSQSEIDDILQSFAVAAAGGGSGAGLPADGMVQVHVHNRASHSALPAVGKAQYSSASGSPAEQEMSALYHPHHPHSQGAAPMELLPPLSSRRHLTAVRSSVGGTQHPAQMSHSSGAGPPAVYPGGGPPPLGLGHGPAGGRHPLAVYRTRALTSSGGVWSAGGGWQHHEMQVVQEVEVGVAYDGAPHPGCLPYGVPPPHSAGGALFPAGNQEVLHEGSCPPAAQAGGPMWHGRTSSSVLGSEGGGTHDPGAGMGAAPPPRKQLRAGDHGVASAGGEGEPQRHPGAEAALGGDVSSNPQQGQQPQQRQPQWPGEHPQHMARRLAYSHGGFPVPPQDTLRHKQRHAAVYSEGGMPGAPYPHPQMLGAPGAPRPLAGSYGGAPPPWQMPYPGQPSAYTSHHPAYAYRYPPGYPPHYYQPPPYHIPASYYHPYGPYGPYPGAPTHGGELMPPPGGHAPGGSSAAGEPHPHMHPYYHHMYREAAGPGPGRSPSWEAPAGPGEKHPHAQPQAQQLAPEPLRVSMLPPLGHVPRLSAGGADCQSEDHLPGLSGLSALGLAGQDDGPAENEANSGHTGPLSAAAHHGGNRRSEEQGTGDAAMAVDTELQAPAAAVAEAADRAESERAADCGAAAGRASSQGAQATPNGASAAPGDADLVPRSQSSRDSGAADGTAHLYLTSTKAEDGGVGKSGHEASAAPHVMAFAGLEPMVGCDPKGRPGPVRLHVLTEDMLGSMAFPFAGTFRRSSGGGAGTGLHSPTCSMNFSIGALLDSGPDMMSEAAL